MKLGRDTQMRSTRAKRGRRVLGLALALILAVGLIAPYFHLHAGGPHPERSAAQRAVVATVSSTAPIGEFFSGAHGPGGPFGPRGSHPVIAHDEPVLAQSDDTSVLKSFAASVGGVLPTAGVMLAVGFVGSLIAFAQPFMSRASRTRGQPSMA